MNADSNKTAGGFIPNFLLSSPSAPKNPVFYV
jgi:hypothetical protein